MSGHRDRLRLEVLAYVWTRKKPVKRRFSFSGLRYPVGLCFAGPTDILVYGNFQFCLVSTDREEMTMGPVVDFDPHLSAAGAATYLAPCLAVSSTEERKRVIVCLFGDSSSRDSPCVKLFATVDMESGRIIQSERVTTE